VKHLLPLLLALALLPACQSSSSSSGDDDTDTGTDADSDTDTDTDTDADADTDSDTDTDTDTGPPLDPDCSEAHWAKRAGADGGAITPNPNAIAALEDGSTLVAGRYYNYSSSHEMYFGEGEPNETVLEWSGGFVARYGPDGMLDWAKNEILADSAEIFGLAVDADGAILICGQYDGDATIGVDASEQLDLEGFGELDMFLAKLDADGQPLWAVRGGGVDDDLCYGISTLSDGSVITIGYFKDQALFGEGGGEETTLVETYTSTTKGDVYLARYDGDGNLVWARRAGSSSRDEGVAVATLPDDEIAVTGFHSYYAVFGEGQINETVLEGENSALYAFAAVYDQDGLLEWATNGGGYGLTIGNGIVALADGTFVISGMFSSTACFNAGQPDEACISNVDEFDVFVARYEIDGSLHWVTSAGGPTSDSATHVVGSADTALFVTGNFGQMATFGKWEENETSLVAEGSADVFVARYSLGGLLDWVVSGTGTSGDWGAGIVEHADETIVVSGGFGGDCTFGLDEPGETTLDCAGLQDMFVAKYEACEVPPE